MKTKPRISLVIVALVLAGAGTYIGSLYINRDVVTVQTTRVGRQDLTSHVPASGEIKPNNYINVSANATGQVTDLEVKEGDSVRRGQLLARIENVQPAADVQAQQASLSSAEADSAAAEAGLRAADENLTTVGADIERNRAALARTQSDSDRAVSLYRDHLLAGQDYELKKAARDSQSALVHQSEARLLQARAQREQAAAQLASARRKIAQIQAGLTRVTDVLQKYDAYAPIDGVVTNLSVRVGETVASGVQSSAASTLLTIADLSLITAEVKVDETDIASLQQNQIADISLDALPNRTLKGHVIEIGKSAILRSTGEATSVSNASSQDAKEFKVVIALDNPPAEIRPGLSCTVQIATATRKNVLAIPVQALTTRKTADLVQAGHGGVHVTDRNAATGKVLRREVQGAFVIRQGKAEFQKVDTGISGVNHIEVVSGLKPGDEIITGSDQVVRTIPNEAPVKRDNRNHAPPEG